MSAKRIGVCNLCEAICGLELTITDGAVSSIRGNPATPTRTRWASARTPRRS